MSERLNKSKKGVLADLLIKGKMDLTFFTLLLILVTVGLIMLFSASYVYADVYKNNSYHFIIKQGLFAIIGIVLMLIASHVNYKFIRKCAVLFYLIMAAFLLIMLIMPPMMKGTDVKRWFAIGSFSFQPSELGKFAVVLMLAHLIAANQKLMKTFKFGVLGLGIVGAVICILVGAEPHLSAAILIFLITIAMMTVGGMRLIYLLIPAGAIAAGIGVLLSGVIGYAKDRFDFWLDPWASASDKGYQTIQSLLSVGSGGWLGRGLGQSRQKYLWVPEPHNDFIFAIVCEELGIIGAMLIIILFCLLIWRGFLIAMKAPDKFSSMLAFGLIFQISIQVALNILVVTNTIPNTGISLPFFSYGGTSLVILLVEMGIVLGISRASNTTKTV